ncbi:MAG TPA: hypothetical protein VHX14_10655, partial [Thermoanaerobaculia bacterium]|nr:hypothetical protein [Thermoanaerobaculia bacterium]
MMRRAIGLVAILLMVGCRNRATGPVYRPPLVIVFADVTDSLKGEELQAVHDSVTDILDRAPENTTVIIYPIEANMAYVRNLFDETVPVAHDVGVTAIKADGGKRKAWATKVIGELAAVARNAPPHTPVSCLAGALRRTARDLESLQDMQGRPIDVVLITDMVEECDNSIGDKKVMLNHPHIAPDITAARTFTRTFADLRNANVYFIYPPGSNSGFDITRP